MNALDSLFDFAALMSTSSAMTHSPDSKRTPDNPAHTAQTSKAPPSQAPQIQLHYDDHPTHHQPPAQNPTNPSLPHYEPKPAAFSRSHADPTHQRPIDWIPASSYSLQAPHSQDPQLPAYHHLPDFSGFDCDFACGHHPDQGCRCAYVASLPVCSPYGCVSPVEVRRVGVPHAEMGVVEFQDGAGGLVCGYGCEERYFGRPCQCVQFALQGCGGGGERVSVAQGEMWMGGQEGSGVWYSDGQIMGGGEGMAHR